MMVAFLAAEDVRNGKFSWSDKVTWTRETVVGRRKNRRKIYTEISYTLQDVFKASMIASNNECCEQMAKFIGCGNLQETIDRMNLRAKELGMKNTFYGNPTGLPAPHSMFDNSSTPTDLLTLTLEMLKFEEVIEIAAMGYASIENGKSSSVISNHNRLTIDYSGEVDGLKTGYTRRAGFCLVATSAKCDHRLISIVLGCRGPQIRNEIVRDMFNDYYTSIALDRLGPNCTPGTNLLASNSNGRYVTMNQSVKKIHVVRSGESISTVAKKYKCTQAQLRSWNKGKIKKNYLMKGQRLAIFVKEPRSIFIKNPVNGSEAEDDKPLITETEKKSLDKAADQADITVATIETAKVLAPLNYLYHTVAPGDTLFNIAKRYEGITVEELKSLNKITDSRNLKPGTKLKVKVRS
jgi:D-alanyl-D-alanine carboxypeptidase (penicillin-binding protein 5/6)